MPQYDLRSRSTDSSRGRKAEAAEQLMFRITLDHANSLYVATFDETISDEDFTEEFRQMVAYPTYNKLVDLRAVKHVEVRRETVRRAIGTLTDATQQVPRKIAVVAPNDIAFGMARTYEAIAPAITLAVSCLPRD